MNRDGGARIPSWGLQIGFDVDDDVEVPADHPGIAASP
jgi:hypothetical protein